MKNNKKLMLVIPAIIFAVLLLVPMLPLHANEINVAIDGQQVNFVDQGPVIVDGRTLVPVRGVFEALGFDVDWNQDTQTATLRSANHEVVITVGSVAFTTNGISHALDVPAQIIGGRTMLPIRAVVESVGYYVDWDGATSTVIISSKPTIIGRWRNTGAEHERILEFFRDGTGTSTVILSHETRIYNIHWQTSQWEGGTSLHYYFTDFLADGAFYQNHCIDDLTLTLVDSGPDWNVITIFYRID